MRSGVPIAYLVAKSNGLAKAEATRAEESVAKERWEASLEGRTCVQMAPEMALPRAEPTL